MKLDKEIKLRLRGLYHRSYLLTGIASVSAYASVLAFLSGQWLNGTVELLLAVVAGAFAASSHKRIWEIVREICVGQPPEA